MAVQINPDEEFVRDVKRQIKENNGHCPCSLPYARSKDTKCMCKDFRDMVKNGEYGACHCGMYINVEENE